MKKVNTQITLKSLAKYVGLIAATVFIFSCAKSGNDAQQNNVFQNCANCGNIMNGQSFFQSQSSDTMYGMTLNLNFIGSQMYNQPYTQQYNTSYPYQNNQYGTTSPIISYSGSVGAQGQLIVTQPVTNGYGYSYGSCYVPAGTYSLDTLQAGQWSQAIVRNLILQANSGGAQLIISIPQAQVSAKTQLGQTWNEVAPTGRLFGNLVIQSVNGMNCQISTLIN
jgi:hypothetical protein